MFVGVILCYSIESRYNFSEIMEDAFIAKFLIYAKKKRIFMTKRKEKKKKKKFTPVKNCFVFFFPNDFFP